MGEWGIPIILINYIMLAYPSTPEFPILTLLIMKPTKAVSEVGI
jgi:hypothetical protein